MNKTFYQHYLSCFIRGAFSTINPGTQLQWNWHLSLISEYLESVTNGQIKRLIINMPPRALKSTCISVCWPAWLLGKNPANRIICASYGQKISEKFSIETRNLIISDFFKFIFPEVKIAADQNQKSKFLTDKRGFRLATSVGGPLTGEGGDFLILDDPHNAAHISSIKRRNAAISWFSQSFATRLDDKKEGRIVIVMQRLHPNDLTGALLDLGSHTWEVLKIPAISGTRCNYFINSAEKIFEQDEFLHKTREDVSEITQAKYDLGTHMFGAQYLQNPKSEDSELFKTSWIKYFKAPPTELKLVTQSWDTAIKTTDATSFTVCTTWGFDGRYHFLLDVYRGKLEYPGLRKQVLEFFKKFKPHRILIEDKASGQSLVQDLRSNAPHLPITAIQVNKDKITRFSSVTPLFENGRIFLMQEAPWRIDYELELASFPLSNTSDQVDSTSQYLNFMIKKTTEIPRIRRL